MNKAILPLLFMLLVVRPGVAALTDADAALLDHDYARAAQLYQGEVDRGQAVDRALIGLGTALRLKGDHEGAIRAFDRVLKELGSSALRARAAFRRAESLGALGRWAEAAEAWQREAERLLSPSRKEEMAQGYLTLAEKAMTPPEGQRGSTDPRDPVRAVKAFGKALEIGLPAERARRLRLDRARAWLAGVDSNAAHEDLVALDRELDAKAPVEASLELAEMLLKAADGARGRRRLREIAGNASAGPVAAKALLALARSYHPEQPANDASFERAVEALRELVRRFPDDAAAIEGRLSLATCLIARGRHDEAQVELKALLEAKGVPDGMLASARIALARSLHQQKRYDDALAAYSAYLSAHPFDRESVNAQREAMDTQYEAACDLADHKKPVEAAKALEAFLARFPLDQRAFDILMRLAKIEEAKEDPKKAVEAYRRVVSKYPGTEMAGNAQYQIGQLYETALADPRGALDEYSKITWGGAWGQKAGERKAALESRELTIAPQRVFRSNEAPELVVRSRNLKNLSVKVYRVDPATYFARASSLGGLDALDIDLINPDHTFEVPLANAKDYVLTETRVALPVKGAGLWVAQVGESELWASIGVLVSDVELLVKSSRGHLFAMTWNALTGAPLPGVALTVSDGARVVVREKTDDAGVFAIDRAELEADRLSVLALHEDSAACTGLAPGAASASSLAPRGFIYTDRPAYRPGQTVHVKAVLRDVKDGAYAFTAGEAQPVCVTYPSGRALWESTVKLSEFGTLALDVAVPPAAPDGDYQVRIGSERKQQFAGAFRVATYQMPSMVVKIEPASTVLAENEPLKGKIRVTRPDGSPVRDAALVWQVVSGDGNLEEHSAITDGKGEVAFEEDTRELVSVTHGIVARVPQESVSARAEFSISGVGVKPSVRVDRNVVLSGEAVTARFSVKDVLGKPVAAPVTLEAVRNVTGAADVVEKTWTGSTDATGEGSLSVALTRGGNFTLRLWAADAKGHRADAAVGLTVTAPDDPVRLRILTESDTVRAGEAASFRVISWARDGQALLTIEGGRVMHHELVSLKTGENQVKVEMAEGYAPNVTLAFALMEGGALHQASRELTVRHGLALDVKPDREAHAPGEEVELKIAATDHLGKPVDAEISVAVVDEALLSLFPDASGSIQDAFQQRRGNTALSTASSAGTTYAASVKTLSEELLAEETKNRRVTMKHDAPTPAGQILREIGAVGGFRVIVPPELERQPITAEFNDVPADEALWSVVSTHGFNMEKVKVAGRTAYVVRRQAGVPVLSAAPAPPPPMAVPMGAAGAGGSAREEPMPQELEDAAKDITADAADLDEAENKPQVQRQMAEKKAMVMHEARAKRKAGRARRGLLMANARAMTKSEASDQSRFDAAGEGGGGGGGGEDEAPAVRDFFPETAFWVASLRTGTSGTTTAKFTLPSSLTRYRILARAVTQGSKVGEATAAVVAAKPLSAELLVPPYMVEGDEAGVFALVRGAFEKPAHVKLTLEGGPSPLEHELDLAPGAEARVPFKVAVPAGESVTLKLTARAESASDAIQRVIPARPRGAYHYDSASGLLTEATGFDLQLSVAEPTHRKLAITLSPGLPGALQDALSGGDAGGSAVDRARQELAAFDAARAVPFALGEVEERRTRIQNLLGQVAGERVDTGSYAPGDVARRLELYAHARKSGFRVADDAFAEAANAARALYPGATDPDKLRILAAQAAAGQADFGMVNRFLRGPHGAQAQDALLAITLARMGRKEKAVEVVSAMAAGTSPAFTLDEDPAETGALRLSALMAARPDAPAIPTELARLLALRGPSGWGSARASAAACEALAHYLIQHVPEAANYRLRVQVGDGPEQVIASDELKAPRTLEIGEDRLPGNRVHLALKLEGRGAVDYRAVLSGFQGGPVPPSPSGLRVNRTWTRSPQMHRGKEVPRGSGCVSGPYTWPQNPVTQLALGQSADVSINVWNQGGAPRGEEMVIEEHLPPGCALVDRSLNGNYRHVRTGDGVITAYYAAAPGYAPTLNYRMVGRLPGNYSVLPARAISLYQPKRYGYSEGKEIRDGRPLVVLEAGQTADADYRNTPDELLFLGKAAFEENDHETAWTLLNALRAYTLNDDAAREVGRILLLLAIERSDNQAVLKNFETLKEKYQDLSLPFDVVLRVGKAHREMNEHEAATLVFRGIAEASFLIEAQLAGEWEQAGDLPRAASTTRSLIAEYPDLSVVQTAHLGLAQLTLERAGGADAGLRHLGQELLEAFLWQNPDSPMDDEATFALSESALASDHPEIARAWAEAGERRYPKSRQKDAFLYTQGWALFAQGDHAKALERLQPVAQETFADGQASESRPLALYLIAQIHHTQGRIAEALAAYRQVADRFTDAKETVEELTAREVSAPEVTRIDPGQPAQLPITVRNVSRIDARAFKVDLMRLYLRERNLAGITRVNLSGIRPLHEATLEVKDAGPGTKRVVSLDLPFKDEGAYLVVLKGEDVTSSALVLISHLSLAVGEEPASGRVRVHVLRQPEAAPVHGAAVRVVGSDSPGISSGRTDPRGLYTAESLAGTSTVIARLNESYAFYRGTQALSNANQAPSPAQQDLKVQVLSGLKNRARSLGQERSGYLQQKVYRNSVQGVQVKQMF